MSSHLRPVVRPAPRPRVLALMAAVLAGLALTACGSSSSPGSSPGSSSSGGASDANALAFSRCMRSHGVTNFPDPETKGGLTRLRFKVAPGGPGPQTMEAAQRACKRYSPAEQVHLSPQEKIERQEQVLKFARCMRAHGVDIHASTSGNGLQIRVGGPASGGPIPESPSFQAAQKACQGLLPLKGGGPATGTAHGGGGPGLGIGG